MLISIDANDLDNKRTVRALLALLTVTADDLGVAYVAPKLELDEEMILRGDETVRRAAEALKETVATLNHATEQAQHVSERVTPTAPPAPPVAATPSAPPPANAGSDLYDSEGYPWDARIHSETRSRNADGTWRVRRGTDKDEVTRVRLEYKNGAANATELADPASQSEQPSMRAPEPPLDPATLGFGQEQQASAPAAPAAPPPAAPAAPSASTTVAPSSALDGVTWPTHILGEQTADKGAVTLFMEYAMNLIGENIVSSEKVMEVVNKNGMANLVAIGNFPEKIPAIVRDIEAFRGA
jgi:hypothetical protein